MSRERCDEGGEMQEAEWKDKCEEWKWLLLGIKVKGSESEGGGCMLSVSPVVWT